MISFPGAVDNDDEEDDAAAFAADDIRLVVLLFLVLFLLLMSSFLANNGPTYVFGGKGEGRVYASLFLPRNVRAEEPTIVFENAQLSCVATRHINTTTNAIVVRAIIVDVVGVAEKRVGGGVGGVGSFCQIYCVIVCADFALVDFLRKEDAACPMITRNSLQQKRYDER